MSTPVDVAARTPIVIRLLRRFIQPRPRLPEPWVWLIALWLGVVVVSWFLARRGVVGTAAGSGASLRVVSLASREGVARALSNHQTFAAVSQVGTVITAWFGVRMAERSGLVKALTSRVTTRLPPWVVSAAVVLTSILASGYGDTAIAVMPALSAAVFAALGRSPLAGAALAFAGAGAAYGANFLVGRVDILLAAETQAALPSGSQPVMPAANFWFSFLSGALLTATAVLVTHRWVEPTLTEVETSLPDVPEYQTNREGRALLYAGVAAAVCVGVLGFLLILPSSPFQDESGTLKPFFVGLPVVVAALLVIPARVFMWTSRQAPERETFAVSTANVLPDLGPYLLTAFAAALVITALDASNVATVFIVKTARIFKAQRLAAMSGIPLLGVLTIYTAAVNFLVPSASAKWALLAPVVVPAALKAGASPESAQAAFRIGDSVTNILTPTMPFTAAFFMLLRRYSRAAHVGTLAALTLPFAAAFLVVWTGLFAVFHFAGLPFGPR